MQNDFSRKTTISKFEKFGGNSTGYSENIITRSSTTAMQKPQNDKISESNILGNRLK